MRKHWRAILLALGSSFTLLMGLLVTANAASASTAPCSETCLFNNFWDQSYTGGGLYILGSTHNEDLVGFPVDNGMGEANVYEFVPTSGGLGQDGYGTLHLNTDPSLCWNAANGSVALDSCPSNDGNELFSFTQSGANYRIYSYRYGEWVAADNIGQPLYFTTGDNDTSLWHVTS
jgi:hypothetical protein